MCPPVFNGSTCCQLPHHRGAKKQMIAELAGDDSGPCGRMPPDAGQYSAVCRAGACVAIHH
jgi:hypothetical protein